MVLLNQTKVLAKVILKVDVYFTIQVVLCPQEVAKMLTRTYLDALTPGMRAKLDPLSRMLGGVESARRISVPKNGSDAASLKHNLWPVEQYKRRQELRTRVADF